LPTRRLAEEQDGGRGRRHLLDLPEHDPAGDAVPGRDRAVGLHRDHVAAEHRVLASGVIALAGQFVDARRLCCSRFRSGAPTPGHDRRDRLQGVDRVIRPKALRGASTTSAPRLPFIPSATIKTRRSRAAPSELRSTGSGTSSAS
jgi:hypothetical protein